MEIKKEKLFIIALIYLYAANFVFLLTWVKWWIAVLACLLMGYGMWIYIKEKGCRGEEEYTQCFKTDDSFRISIPFCTILILTVLLMGLLCGYGGVFVQTGDWIKHNAILQDLVTREWPVYYQNTNGLSMLSYYLGQYLIPGVVGKLFSSLRVAEIALLVYNCAGIFIAMLLLFYITRANTTKRQVIVVAVFYTFGAVILISHGICGLIGHQDIEEMYYYWVYQSEVSLRSMINCLRWVFQLGITTWISTALFLNSYRNPRYYVAIAAPLLLNTVFCFLGLGVVMIAVYITVLYSRSQEWKRVIVQAISIPNLAVMLGAVVIPLIYLSGNILGDKPQQVGAALIRYTNVTSITYFAIIAGFLCYSLLLWKLYERNPLFYIINGFLLLIPFVRMGLYNDLAMNASIPVLYILMVFVIYALFNGIEHQKLGVQCKTGLTVLLLWSAVYCVYDISDALKIPPSWNGNNRSDGIVSLEGLAGNPDKLSVDYAYNYYSFQPEDSFFGQFLARTPAVFKPNYELGTEILFNESEWSEEYIEYGMSFGGTDITWSDGQSSSIALCIEDMGYDVEATFEFVCVFDGSQPIIVTCAGQELFSDVIDSENLVAKFKIPSELIEDGMIRLEISYPNAKSPMELGTGEDQRLLAVGYHKMIFTQAV